MNRRHASSLQIRSCRGRRGFTLAEVAISTLLVGTLLIASLESVVSVMKYRNETTDALRGSLLAEELLSRLLQLPYQDPDDYPVFGREWSELYGSGIYDDVDDYNGFVESPPKDANGASMSDFSGWERRVSVDWVQIDNLTRTISSDQGVKRVTVTIRKNGSVVVTRWGMRTDITRLDVSDL